MSGTDVVSSTVAVVAILISITNVLWARVTMRRMKARRDETEFAVPGGIITTMRKMTAGDIEEFRQRWVAAVSEPRRVQRQEIAAIDP